MERQLASDPAAGVLNESRSDCVGPSSLIETQGAAMADSLRPSCLLRPLELPFGIDPRETASGAPWALIGGPAFVEAEGCNLQHAEEFSRRNELVQDRVAGANVNHFPLSHSLPWSQP